MCHFMNDYVCVCARACVCVRAWCVCGVCMVCGVCVHMYTCACLLFKKSPPWYSCVFPLILLQIIVSHLEHQESSCIRNGSLVQLRPSSSPSTELPNQNTLDPPHLWTPLPVEGVEVTKRTKPYVCICTHTHIHTAHLLWKVTCWQIIKDKVGLILQSLCWFLFTLFFVSSHQ